MVTPKHAREEHERRFLVTPADVDHLTGRSFWVMTDKYLAVGRLRLRWIRDASTGEDTYKLCKKYGPIGPGREPIVNIYLSQDEYEMMNVLPGKEIMKHRYHEVFMDRVFAVDMFRGALEGLAMCEIEAASAKDVAAIQFPDYARLEVTADAFFTGGKLCEVDAAALTAKLATTMGG